ncbi:hypothetical protein [Lampropedia aestuarii]|uniref:hypothetical protein n=1 Tax=Lampropedia aestuarii TaxID=2562762 RepID=UPI00246891D5|nr:hypothetical protein [Lampropedia aestuarii]MDH5857798.1 hypothetical protein [Lampropedia aestuarii]
MPADSSQALGHENLMQMGNSQSKVPVAVSNGEHELPPEQVHAIGVQALDQMKAATHRPVGGLHMQPPQEPQRYFANGGQVGGFGILRRATGGVVSEEERQRQNVGVAGAPGVQRTGSSYSDAPRAPAAQQSAQPAAPQQAPANNTARGFGIQRSGNSFSDAPKPAAAEPRLGMPSWEGRQSFPATHQRAAAPASQTPTTSLADQIPNETRLKAPASQPAASPALGAQAQADRQAVGGVVNKVRGWGADAGAAVADAATMIPRGLAGAYDSAVIRPMRAAGFNAAYLSPALTPTGADVSSPTPFTDVRNQTKQAEAQAQATASTGANTEPKGLRFNNDQLANNMLGINGITKSPLSGVGATGPLKQADLMARTPGTGRGIAPGAQASPSAPQEQATIPYMADGRRGKTNAEVGAENPAGRVQMVRQPNGTMSFSGTDVRGPVSYTDGQGQPLAGGGLRGRGFSSVDTVASNAMGAAQGRQSSGQALSAARDAAVQRGDWDGVAQSYASQGRGFDGRSPAQIQAGLNRPATIVDAPRLGFSTRAERSEQLRQQRMQDAMRDGNMANAQRSALADIYRSDNNLREASVRGANEMARAQMEQQAATQRQENSNTASLTEVAMREAGQTQRAQPEAQLGLRTMALREAEAGDASKIRGFEIEHAQRLQGLRTQYAAAKNDTERASIARQIQELSGNARPQNENLSNSFMAVGGGQEWNQEAGIMRNVPQRLIDLRTGQEVGGAQQGIQPTANHINGLRENPSQEMQKNFDIKYGLGAAAKALQLER